MWTIVCAAGSVALFLRVHWLRQTEDVAWKIRMEKLAGEPEPEEFKDNSTKKMLRKLGMLTITRTLTRTLALTLALALTRTRTRP